MRSYLFRQPIIKVCLILIILLAGFITGISVVKPQVWAALGKLSSTVNNKQSPSNASTKGGQEGNKIVYYTQAYDTFTDWDWFISTRTSMAMGAPKNGPLSDFGLKLSPINYKNPNPWAEGEYFCDPDSVLAVSGSKHYEVAYLSYLNWKKDLMLFPGDKMARISFKYRDFYGLNNRIANTPGDTNSPLKLNIRVDHTLEEDKPWVKTAITLTNNYDEPVNLLYVYQDAAYMWFPDKGQQNVLPLVSDYETGLITNKYYFEANQHNSMVAGTYNKNHGVFSGIRMDSPYAYLGVIPEYAFFGKHLGTHPYLKDLGYAKVDSTRREFSDILNNLKKWNGQDAKPGDLKNRILVVQIDNLKPGENRAFEFMSTGISQAEPLNLKDWAKKIKEYTDWFK